MKQWSGIACYVTGGMTGFCVAILDLSNGWQPLIDWVSGNLGYSVLPFGCCMLAWLITLNRLADGLKQGAEYQRVAQLDQLTDVWIHLFVGIGVVWTAIGMRSALVNTLSDTGSVGADAGHVLEQLVDGGILLALSTTIVGAVGGYLFRLTKSLWLGTRITEFYREQDNTAVNKALDRLTSIEALMNRLTTREPLNEAA